jgi:hypothetical protein
VSRPGESGRPVDGHRTDLPELATTGDLVLDAALDYGLHTWDAATASQQGRLVESNAASRRALAALGRLLDARRDAPMPSRSAPASPGSRREPAERTGFDLG